MKIQSGGVGMITALQIALLLVLIAIIGIILGYLFGRLACKRKESSVYFEKNDYCEGKYQQNIVENYSNGDINSHYNAADIELNNNTGKSESANSKQSVASVSDEHKPAVLEAPKDEKDKLSLIKGIGSVIEQKLNDLGIFHFEQIAAWSEKEIEWIDHHLAFSGRILREDWIGQAKELSKDKHSDVNEAKKEKED